jgi:hypothetical protein
MSGESNESRKFTSTVSLLEDFPGADITKDAVRVVIAASELEEGVEVEVPGVVDVQESSPLDVSGATLTITDDGDFNIHDSSGSIIEEPLDVSDATVTVTDDGSLNIVDSADNIIEEPLDVSGGVVSVSEDSPLDVSGATVDVNINNLPDVLTNESYGVDIENDVQRTLTVGSYSLVDVSITTSVSTSATVEKSWDGNNWFEVESFSNTSKVDDNLRGAGGTQYRVTVSGTGAGGDTADIVIAAKSR